MEIAMCVLTIAILVNITISIMLIGRIERQYDEINEINDIIDEIIEYME